jgi:putative transposase
MGRQEWDRVALHRSRQVQQNGVIESVKGSLRDELLNEELFGSLADARWKLAIWRCDDSHVRPHSSLRNWTPAQVRQAFEQNETITSDALVQMQDTFLARSDT